MSFFSRFLRSRRTHVRTTFKRPRQFRTKHLASVERLESRSLLSITPVGAGQMPLGGVQPASIMTPIQNASVDPTATYVNGITPEQMRHAYGIDQVSFNGIVGDGSGQTIAIVDLYDDPNIAADVDAFDKQFSIDGGSETLYQQYGASGNFLTKYEPQGTPSPAEGNWGIEIAMDVEWVHSIAPGAKILLTEAATDVYSAAVSAAQQPGVCAVSMSWGEDEFSGETAYDRDFTTPAGHNGVTFLAATGDYGAGTGGANALYPAYSPNVVGVGGTTLSVDANGNYLGESGWSSGGGGISQFESQPLYQAGTVTQSSTQRTIPDIAMDADPNTGAAVYDSYDYPTSPWLQVGGTSLATPMWSAVVGVVDQGRALQGRPTLDGQSQTLPRLYDISQSDLHDITSGNNGFAAGPGYDLVTGRGTPLAQYLVPALVDNAVTISGGGAGDAVDVTMSGQKTQVTVNGKVIFSSLPGAIDELNFNMAGGISLTVDYSHGNPVPDGSISFNGGSGGSNSLSIIADANITQTSGGWSLSGNVNSTVNASNVSQTTLTGGSSANTFTVDTGTVTINLGAGDQAILNDESGGTSNTLTGYADQTNFTGTGFSYQVVGVGAVTANVTSADTATIFDHTYADGQSGPDVLDASTGPNTATMRYFNGASLSVVGLGHTTAVQQFGPDFATQAAASAPFIVLQGTWHTPTITPSALQNSIPATAVAQTGALNAQYLFTVGSDGLVYEDRYDYSSHADSGLSVIDPNTVFPQGAELTAYSDGSTVNVFGVAADGKAKWAQYTAAHGWTGFVSLDQYIGDADASFAPGTALTGSAHSGALELFGVDTAGHVRQYSYSSSGNAWTLDDTSFLPSFPAGAPLAAWDSGSGIDVAGVLANGNIEFMHDNNGGWTWIQTGGVGLSGPTPLAISEANGTAYLFAVTSAGAVDEIYSSNSFGYYYWNIISVGSDTFGSNAALGVQQYAPGEFRLFGVNNSGAIKNDYYVDGGSWGSQTLGGAPAFSADAGVALYADPSGVFDVFGKTTTGDLAVEEYNTSAWNEYALGRSLAPTTLQNSIVATTVGQVGNLNEQDLFVVGSDGFVREDKYYYATHTDSGLSPVDLSTKFNVGARLTAYSDGSTTNVFGVGQDGKVKWAQYTAGKGWTGFVSLDSFIPGADQIFESTTSLVGFAGSGYFDLFAVGTDGYIREYSYSQSSSKWSLYDLNGLPSFPASTALAVWDTGSRLDMFGVMADGSVETVRYDGNLWYWNNIAGVGLSGPTPLAVSESGSTITLFGVTNAGAVDEIYSSDEFQTYYWNIISVGSDTYGSDAVLGVQQYAPGEFRLFGVNNSGAVKNDYYVDGGSWGNQDLGGSPAFSASAGVAFYADPSGVFQVFGLTTSGSLAVEEYNGSSWEEYALS